MAGDSKGRDRASPQRAGGIARANALTPDERRAIARKGGFAKAGKMPLVDGVLHLSVLADGSARLRLDVTVPADRAIELARCLLVAGIITATE
jgi:hypothetical protein